MIADFVKAWDIYKGRLEEYFRTHDQREYSKYEDIVRHLFMDVINPFLKMNYNNKKFDTEKIHVIDDGEYQGDQLFIIPEDIYQPAPHNYVWTYASYGSCSGCDILQGIQAEGEHYLGLPTEKQVKEYMSLALNLLQYCRRLFNSEEDFNE